MTQVRLKKRLCIVTICDVITTCNVTQPPSPLLSESIKRKPTIFFHSFSGDFYLQIMCKSAFIGPTQWRERKKERLPRRVTLSSQPPVYRDVLFLRAGFFEVQTRPVRGASDMSRTHTTNVTGSFQYHELLHVYIHAQCVGVHGCFFVYSQTW